MDTIFRTRFGMQASKSMVDVEARAAELADEFFGDAPYDLEVDATLVTTMGGGASHYMVDVTGRPSTTEA